MIFNLGGGAAAPKLTSIAVTTNPTKTAYYKGESFNKSGMIVTAYFDDGSSSVVTGYTYSPTTMAQNTSSVTVSYTHEGITKTTTVSVKVNLYLYNAGTTDSLVGSWGVKGNNADCTPTLESSYIKLSGNYVYGNHYVWTTNKIDLSGYTSLKVTVTTRGDSGKVEMRIGYCSSITPDTSNFVANTHWTVASGASTYSKTLNLSSASTSYYIMVWLGANTVDTDVNYARVTKIELLK